MGIRSGSISFFHLNEDWGLFLGVLDHNQFHQHFAIQVSLGITEPVKIMDQNATMYKGNQLLIAPNRIHRIESNQNQLLLLFDPFSPIGHLLKEKTRFGIDNINATYFVQLSGFAKLYLQKRISPEDFIGQVKRVLNTVHCNCSFEDHVKDIRISNALRYLLVNHERIVPLEEIANHCHLSEGRFIHLFKEVTGLTYRRAQLWNKIKLSIPYLLENSVTETAHQFGFTDSSHYTRTFKENFGFPPKFLLKY